MQSWMTSIWIVCVFFFLHFNRFDAMKVLQNSQDDVRMRTAKSAYDKSFDNKN